MHSLNKHFKMPCVPDPLLGDTGTTELHQNQWPPPLSEPCPVSLPSFPVKLIHGDLLTACFPQPLSFWVSRDFPIEQSHGLLVLTLLSLQAAFHLACPLLLHAFLVPLPLSASQ